MNFNSIKYKANYYVLLMLAFVIPLERKLIAPLIILFLITSLVNAEFKSHKKKNILLFSSIYIFYLAGLLYSNDIDLGGVDVTTKLSLIILPISFFVARINFKGRLNSIMISFIEGCFVSAFIAIITSTIKYYYSFDMSTFFYGNVALFSHPSYLAILISLSLIILYYSLLEKDTSINIKKKVSILLLLFFSIFILLLSSKTGLITMLLIHLSAISFWIIKRKSFLKGIGTLLLLAGSFTITYNYSNLFKERINEVFSVAQSPQEGNSSTAARKTIWITSLDLIKTKPLLGYGTGDAKKVLIDEYKKRELNYLHGKKLNAHNQFLQTTLALGIFGGFILMMMLIIPLFNSIKKKHFLYTGFLLLIIINFLTESMLERQLGVVFYAFFNCLFFMAYFSNNALKTEE